MCTKLMYTMNNRMATVEHNSDIINYAGKIGSDLEEGVIKQLIREGVAPTMAGFEEPKKLLRSDRQRR